MARVVTFFRMALAAFVFWQTMDRVHQERMAKEAEIKRMREELLRQNKEAGVSVL